MRPVLWIAADMLRDAVTRPAPMVAAVATIVLVPLQAGIVDGFLWKAGAGLEHGVHRLLTTSALCPALSAVILFSGVMFPRLITGELEPLLQAPLTDRVIALGCVLPFLAVAAAGSIPASGLALLGMSIPSGSLPPGALADCVELFLSAQVSTAWMGAALIRSVRRLASPGFTVWNVLVAFLALATLDAVAIIQLEPGGVVLPAVRVGAFLACWPAAWWFSRRIDRDAFISTE